MGEGPLRKTWPQRILIGVNALVLVAWVGAMAFGALLYQRVQAIPTVDIGDGALPGSPTTALRLPEGPQNFLLVGSDTRAGQDETAFGDAAGQRADVILLVRVDIATGTAAMVSFPRDLFVTIRDVDGTDLGEDRINTAFDRGPAQLVATIRADFGIPVDHYVQVNFAGFEDIVDAIGGVTVHLAGPIRDRDQLGRNRAGLDIDAVGCVELDGSQTLAYVRSRHFEQLVDGRWQLDPTADLGRIRRQQDLARRIVHEALDDGLYHPARIVDLLDVAKDNLVIDRGLGPAEIVAFGQQLGAIQEQDIDQRTLLVRDDITVAGARILRMADDPANEATLGLFRPPPAVTGPTPSVATAPTLLSPTTSTAAPAC